MTNCTILFKSNNNEFQEPLFLEQEIFEEIRNRPNVNSVFSNKKYNLSLINTPDDIINVNLFINGHAIKSSFDNGTFTCDDELLFLDIYGYTYLSVQFIFADGNMSVLHTPYIHVYISEEDANTVKSMIKYIHKHTSMLFPNGNVALDSVGYLNKTAHTSLEIQLELFKKILRVYKSNFDYFKSNRNFNLRDVAKYGDIKNAFSVNSETLNSVLQKPYHFQRTEDSKGIYYDGDYLLPQKLLIPQKNRQYDTYENTIILSFLYTMFFQSNNILDNLHKMMQKQYRAPKVKFYTSSDEMIFSTMSETFEKYIIELESIAEQFQKLFVLYLDRFKCSYVILNSCPVASSILLNTIQYRTIYQLIVEWFQLNDYEFENEKFLLSLLANNKVYEYYLLLKLLNYFRDTTNFDFQYSKKFIYSQSKVERYANTFVFQNEENEITVYYQPTVYSFVHTENNGVNLIRNNNISTNAFFRDRNSSRDIFLPDFIVKFKTSDSERYIILDAKFSRQKTVVKYYLENLIFKYIFSICPLNNSVLLGLCALNGKSDSSDKSNFYSIYNNNIPTNYLPSVHICTVSPDTQDFLDDVADFDNFTTLFESLICHD